jgi:hypothetical protein
MPFLCGGWYYLLVISEGPAFSKLRSANDFTIYNAINQRGRQMPPPSIRAKRECLA